MDIHVKKIYPIYMNWLQKIDSTFFKKSISKIFKNKPKIIIICGPTATGKTSLSLQIAKQYNGEIISADSRQVYKGLDIGSAKVTKQEMNGIPHHMIDVADPKNTFTAQEFVEKSKKIILQIMLRGNTPIICGGTGMYIDALVYNQSFPNVPPNKKLREKLEQLSIDELFKQLQQKDPRRANTIDKNNKVRVIRSLEIIDSIGIVPKQKQSTLYNPLFIGLDVHKDILNERILERIIERLENQDMLHEVKSLYKNGISYERMESLGLEYRFMARYLQHKITYDNMIEQLHTATKQFAKRQRTWFKRNKKIHWFNPTTDQKDIHFLVKKFMSK
jgi:tRNA dimethylallyltransferase